MFLHMIALDILLKNTVHISENVQNKMYNLKIRLAEIADQMKKAKKNAE